MTPSPELFDLIKSLTQAEKTYYKKFITLQKADNHYALLFKLIEKQKSYDEAKVKAQIKNAKLLKNYASIKNHFYNSILKSLRNFHSGLLTEIKVKNEIINAVILKERKLYKQSETCLYKARELAAESYEYWSKSEADYNLFELVYSQNLSPKKVGDINHFFSNIIESNNKQLDFIYAKWNEALTFSYLYEGTGTKRLNPEKKHFDKINELSKIPVAKIDTYARMAVYMTRGAEQIKVGNWTKAIAFYDELIKLNQTEVAFFKKNPGYFFSAVNNKAACFIQLKRYEGLPQLAKQLSSVITFSTRWNMRMYIHSLFIETAYYTFTKQFKQGLMLAQKIETDLKRKLKPLDVITEDAMFRNIASLFYYGKQYKKAQKYVSLIFKKGIVKNSEVIVQAQLLLAIIKYEKRDTVWLNKNSESIQLLLKSNKSVNDYHYLIFSCLIDLLKADKTKSIDNRNKVIAKYVRLNAKLSPKISSSDTAYFDIDYWLTSRI